MLPTNNKLMAMEATASSLSKEEQEIGVKSLENAHELVDKVSPSISTTLISFVLVFEE